MKVIILGDFGGTFSNTLFRALKDEKADLILCTGDYADVKIFMNLFLKYGPGMGGNMTTSLEKKARRKQLATGLYVLRKLSSIGTPALIVFGNNDMRKQDEFTKWVNRARNIQYIDGRLKSHKGLQVYGWSNPEYGHMKTIKDRKFFSEIIDKRLPKNHEYIFLTHIPPWNTALDINLNKKRNYKKHVGSKVVNHVLWHHRPAMILCGHLEEHTGECVKRGVRVINPGAAERNQYAVMEFEGDYSKAKITYWKATDSGKRKARLTDTA